MLEPSDLFRKKPPTDRLIVILHCLFMALLVPAGKTTLADSLVASNGIISHRQVGKVRVIVFVQLSS